MAYDPVSWWWSASTHADKFRDGAPGRSLLDVPTPDAIWQLSSSQPNLGLTQDCQMAFEAYYGTDHALCAFCIN
jgi:hypothetical protein